jgi:Protein of unknown function (DUF2934)
VIKKLRCETSVSRHVLCWERNICRRWTRRKPFARGAYFLWESEGRPEGRALDHWKRAAAENRFVDEEKVLAGRPDANIPAMLTEDVPGG